jgi:uncharacterized membrane protein YccC
MLGILLAVFLCILILSLLDGFFTFGVLSGFLVEVLVNLEGESLTTILVIIFIDYENYHSWM